MNETQFTDDNFKKEVLNSKDLVLIDFYADWCGPCKAQSPIIEELAKEYEGKGIKVGKMDIDKNPQSPSQYQVMSIPNLVFFKNGEAVKQLVGLHDKAQLVSEIDKLLT